ncbi:MAG: CPBP family intramembrane metalloprotease [Pirellulales bacterium]|nr:CPBP family intramembrane metalloprotease [Pirellulales bacterium]
MDQESQNRKQLLERARQNMVAVAAAFEGGLAVLAWFLGWVFGYPPADTIRWRLADVGYGLLWTLPLIPPMLLMARSRWRPFVRIQQIVSAIIVPLFSGCSIFQLALISLLAGLGEEALFRGFIQNSLAQEGNAWGAIVVASILFGLAHMITPAYALLATLIGVYLGWLMQFHDNLIVSVTVHAAYDFVALVYLIQLSPRSQVVLRRTNREMESFLDDYEHQFGKLDPSDPNDREQDNTRRQEEEQNGDADASGDDHSSRND